MPKIKKRTQSRHLSRIKTWLIDTNPFSDYFRLTQVPEIFSGGKSGFLINGSPNLVRTTEVLVELTDINGNVVFTQPIRNYQEGLARVVSVEVYDDVPPGPALLTILGEVAFDKDGNRVPNDWIGTYNVKWQKIINIEPTKQNTSPIRLYNRPILSVTEELIPFRQSVTGSNISISSGTITGQYVSPTVQLIGNDITNLQRQVNTEGTVISCTAPIFVRGVENGIFYAYVEGLPFTSSVEKIQSSTSLKLNNFLTSSTDSIISRWTTSNYTMSYQEPPTFITSSLNRSFANIKLSNLTTFTGDIQRAKFYVRGIDEGEKYELLEDVILESVELTVSRSVTGEQIQLGELIDQPFVDQYWDVGTITNGIAYNTGNVTASYNNAVLIDSLTIVGPGTGSTYASGSSVPRLWYGINQDLIVESDVEYTIQMDVVCVKQNPSYEAKLDIRLDGPSLSNGVNNSLGYLITSLKSEIGQTRRTFQNLSFNFTVPAADLAKLRFVTYGGQWYVSKVKLLSSRESGFNPDSISIFAPVIGRRFERLQFKAELYDANSNLVPLNIETDFIYFNGGNLVFRGVDTRIDGTLTVGPSGSGPILSSIAGGSYIGIFSGSLPYSISSGGLESYTGSPIISIFSGTSPFIDLPNVPAVGFQIIGSQSYLHYDSNIQRLIIKGDISVIPGSFLSSSLVSSSYYGLSALEKIQNLVDGAGPVLPSGTFINGTSVISPNIGGTNGYFSQQFGVGNIIGGNGIILTALGYTSSVNLPMSGSPAIFIGRGQHASSSTPFLVASSSQGAVLSLSDVLVLEPSASIYTLRVKGRIQVVDPTTNQVSNFNDVRKVIANRMAFGPFGFYICNL